MMTNDQTIPCPVCQNPIIFEVKSLIEGKQFGCVVCDAKISLVGESVNLVEESMDKLEKLKQNTLKK